MLMQLTRSQELGPAQRGENKIVPVLKAMRMNNTTGIPMPTNFRGFSKRGQRLRIVTTRAVMPLTKAAKNKYKSSLTQRGTGRETSNRILGPPVNRKNGMGRIAAHTNGDGPPLLARRQDGQRL